MDLRHRGRTLSACAHSPGNWGYGEYVASWAANQFDFICPNTNRVRLIQVDAEYHEISDTFAKMPWTRCCRAAEGFLSSDAKKLEILRCDGAIYEMDAAAKEFNTIGANGDCHRRVSPFQWPRSPDGAEVYVGYGPPRPSATSTELRVFDTSSWQQLGTVRTSVPFWSAAVSNDGRFVYAVAPEQKQLLAIEDVA
jgi:hypothetical protein